MLPVYDTRRTLRPNRCPFARGRSQPVARLPLFSRLDALTDLLTVIEVREARPDQCPRKSRRRLVISAGFSSQSQWPESLTTSPVTSVA